MIPELRWAVGSGFVLVLTAVAAALVVVTLVERKDKK